MPMPTDIGIVDTMIGFPHKDMKDVYAFITRQTKDRESKDGMTPTISVMDPDGKEKLIARAQTNGRSPA